MNELVEYAPCVFCGYNGAGFYQAGTHAEDCPWYTVGGGEERSVMLRKVVASLFKEHRHSSPSAPLPDVNNQILFMASFLSAAYNIALAGHCA